MSHHRRLVPSCRILLCLSGLFGAILAEADTAWPTRADVNLTQTITVSRNGRSHTFKLLTLSHDTMSFLCRDSTATVPAYYRVRARVEVDGVAVDLVGGPYTYPVVANGLRLHLNGSKAWLAAGAADTYTLPTDVRLHFTDAGETWGPTYPVFPLVNFRWHTTTYHNTWLGLVPQDTREPGDLYYHKGEDLGATTNSVDVVAMGGGTVTRSNIDTVIQQPDSFGVWYAHMNGSNSYTTTGQVVGTGQSLGLTGNNRIGGQGAHVHIDMGENTGNRRTSSFPVLADAYLRMYPDPGIAIAGGAQTMLRTETRTLDGRRSLARPGRLITGYRWILWDGAQETVVNSADGTAVLSPVAAGLFDQELRVFFDDGSEARDITQVRVFEPGKGNQFSTLGQLYVLPMRGNHPGDPVTISHETATPVATVVYGRTFDFGDCTPAVHVGDITGIAQHAYAAPGLYTVTVVPDGVGYIENPASSFGFDPACHKQRYKTTVLVEPFPRVGPGGIRVEAERYDQGGAGVGFRDTDGKLGAWNLRNGGTGYEVDVDIAPEGPHVGWFAAGEWLRYTIDVPATANYELRLRVANGNATPTTGALAFRWNGSLVTAPIDIPPTGGWATFTTITVPGVSLSAGVRPLELLGYSGGVNLNWIEVAPVGLPPYATWIAAAFPGGNAAQIAPTADPDGDGLSNLLEYGLGRAPNAAEPPLAPTLWTDTGTGSQYLELTFKRARGVAVDAEISDDLVTWSSGAANLVQVGTAVPDATGLYETVTYRSPTTRARPRQFLRVRVTSP